jgi:uncharacterized protein (TIRG00374 family)
LKAHTYRKYIEFAALCFVAVALFWWFGRKLNWNEVRHALHNANPYMLAGAVAIITSAYFIRAARWGALLKPLGPARFSALFVATTVGFGSFFLIGRAGEVVRPVVLPMRDPRVRPGASFVTILVERLYDSIAVFLMFAVNLIWLQAPNSTQGDFARVRTVGFVLLAVALAVVAGLTWFRKKSAVVLFFLERLFTRWSFIPRRLTRLIIGLVDQLAQALRVLVNFGELAETVGWTALLWFGVAFANLLVIRAFGLPFGLSQTIFVLGCALLGSLIPTPGGAAGAFHAATAAGLIFLGATAEKAAAISIVLHVVDFGPAVLFGLFFLLRGDLNLTRLRTLASAQEVEHVVEDEKLVPDNSPVDRRALENTASG